MGESSGTPWTALGWTALCLGAALTEQLLSELQQVVANTSGIVTSSHFPREIKHSHVFPLNVQIFLDNFFVWFRFFKHLILSIGKAQ